MTRREAQEEFNKLTDEELQSLASRVQAEANKAQVYAGLLQRQAQWARNELNRRRRSS